MEYEDLLKQCELCPRHCGVNRLNGERGFCGAGDKVRIALVSLHPWEEPCLTGENGAGTVFFSHCNLRCAFCQNSVISSEGQGNEVSTARLTEIFLEQQQRGAATLDLVTPTHYAPQIVAALRAAKEQGLTLPVVWNSSGYETVAMVEFVAPMVDVFLPDLKYYSSELAARYSAAADYFAVATQAILKMVELKGCPQTDKNGLLTKGVLVRHLVLPNARKDSMALLDWVAENLAGKVKLSLMNQYTPLFRATEFKEINRRLTTFEYESVAEHALDLGLDDCYVQERRAASAEYVPDFDGRGVLKE